MRFDCGETLSEKLDRLEKWHKWFAWYPVRVASHDCRWLETIERKKEWESCPPFGYSRVKYRGINK